MAAADKKNSRGFNAPAVVLSGAAAIIFLYAVSLFIQGGFLAAQANEVRTKVYGAAGSEEALAAVAAQKAILNEKPRWLDEGKTTLCLPIEDAMQRLVTKAGNSQ